LNWQTPTFDPQVGRDKPSKKSPKSHTKKETTNKTLKKVPWPPLKLYMKNYGSFPTNNFPNYKIFPTPKYFFGKSMMCDREVCKGAREGSLSDTNYLFNRIKPIYIQYMEYSRRRIF